MPKQPRAYGKTLLGLLPKSWQRLYESAYSLCYGMGVHTMRVIHQTHRSASKLLAPWRRLFVYAWQRLVWRHVCRWGAEWKRFFKGFAPAARRIGEAWKRHPLEGIWRAVATPFLALRRHYKGLLTLFNVLAPLCAAYAMIVCVRYWGNATFALRLEYKGETIGYIADEAVFDQAATLAEGRVAGVDASFAVERTPTMTVTLAQEDSLLSQTELCDRILKSYDSDLSRLSGVYVDGSFIGAVTSSTKTNALLQALLDSHRDEAFDTDEVSFLQQVELIDGLYPASTKLSLPKLKTMLTDRSATEKRYSVQEGDTINAIALAHGLTRRQLLQMNEGLNASALTPEQSVVVQKAYAYLDVQVVRLEVTEEHIPFSTETVNDPNRYIGDNYVKVPGEDGIRTIIDRAVYVDGQEISRTNVSAEVTKNPVTQVYAKGAYNVNADARPGVATGRFIWPVPSSYNIICGWYGYAGHRGIDIAGSRGAALLAADGGRVVEVNYSGYGQGWGSYVLIDHGNGYMTRYAHCSSVLVGYGEYVTQGQLIARMGDTGRAYGVHLHFEVYRYGTRINPYPLLP